MNLKVEAGGLESVAVKTSSQQPPNPSPKPSDPTTPTTNVSSAASTSSPSPSPSQAGKRKAGSQGGSGEKRQKNSESPERFIQHPRFWFSDGNVQIQVGPIRFNLHRTRLVASSSFFQEYLKSDEPEVELDEDEKDEPEVIELDDMGLKITDFEQLLIAMDDIVDYYRSPPSFATLASILRAASILEFPKFQTYACDAIQALFPDSPKTVRTNIIPYAAEAVILAREWDLPGVLKRAFYELARSPPTASTARALNLLSPGDIVLVAQAQKHLAAVWPSLYTLPQCDGCASSIRSVVAKQSDTSWFTSLSAKYQFDPILGLAVLPQDYAKQKHYCLACAKIRERVWRTRASNIWKTDLDVWFGLGEDPDTDE